MPSRFSLFVIYHENLWAFTWETRRGSSAFNNVEFSRKVTRDEKNVTQHLLIGHLLAWFFFSLNLSLIHLHSLVRVPKLFINANSIKKFDSVSWGNRCNHLEMLKWVYDALRKVLSNVSVEFYVDNASRGSPTLAIFLKETMWRDGCE